MFKLVAIASLLLWGCGGYIPPAPGSLSCTTDMECERLYGYDQFGYDNNGTCIVCEREYEDE